MAVALQRLGRLHIHPQHAGQRPPRLEQWVRTVGVSHAVVVGLVPSLVWGSQLGCSLEAALGPCRPLTVREVTAMQLGQVLHQREQVFGAFAAQALRGSGVPHAQWAGHARAFASNLQRIWKVPWENAHKEVLWRMAVNGVVGAGGHGICYRQPCPCGFQLTDAQYRAGDGRQHQQHAFWDCPVAQAVREQLQRGLGVPLQQRHVWLVVAPEPGVQRVVWQVVALAALEAMEAGRRAVWRRHHQGVDAAGAVAQARMVAVAAFWLAVSDFGGSQRRVPRRGWEGVGQHHPFLAVRQQGDVVPCLAVVLPFV
jgi:hypothetical protein